MVLACTGLHCPITYLPLFSCNLAALCGPARTAAMQSSMDSFMRSLAADGAEEVDQAAAAARRDARHAAAWPPYAVEVLLYVLSRDASIK